MGLAPTPHWAETQRACEGWALCGAASTRGRPSPRLAHHRQQRQATAPCRLRTALQLHGPPESQGTADYGWNEGRHLGHLSAGRRSKWAQQQAPRWLAMHGAAAECSVCTWGSGPWGSPPDIPSPASAGALTLTCRALAPGSPSWYLSVRVPEKRVQGAPSGKSCLCWGFGREAELEAGPPVSLLAGPTTAGPACPAAALTSSQWAVAQQAHVVVEWRAGLSQMALEPPVQQAEIVLRWQAHG